MRKLFSDEMLRYLARISISIEHDAVSMKSVVPVQNPATVH